MVKINLFIAMPQSTDLREPIGGRPTRGLCRRFRGSWGLGDLAKPQPGYRPVPVAHQTEAQAKCWDDDETEESDELNKFAGAMFILTFWGLYLVMVIGVISWWVLEIIAHYKG